MSRRALQHLGGETRCGGESALADMLRAAFEAAEHEAPDALTHGFHSYPARMHFAIARTIIESVSSVGARVLDPFCGSGTVPLEAMLAGAHAHGVDLNPLALRIAAVKCQRRGLAEQDAFVQSLSAVVEASKARVRSRTPVLAPLGPQERRFYDPHVLKELAGLWAEIEAVEDARDKAALQVLFSSIVVKFSRQRADTSAELVHKRIGRFIPTEFFERKGLELVERWAALDEACGQTPVKKPVWLHSDARKLPRLFDRPFELILSSPPYGGTYDYVEHHARRLAWLGLTTKKFAARELGARRRFDRAVQADHWEQEVAEMLSAMRAVLAPGGLCVVLLGDAQIGERRIGARVQLERISPAVGLEVVAWASQKRPDWSGGRPRLESLIALRGVDAPGPRQDDASED